MFDKQRICIILTSPFTFNAFMRGHTACLSKIFDVTVCLNTTESNIPLLIPSGVRLIHMPIVRDIKPIKDLIALLKVWSFLRRERFDLVFSITPKGGMVAMLAALFAGVHLRVHCFTGQVWATRRGFKRFLLKMVDRVIAAAATNLLTDSSSQMNFLINENIVFEENIRVLGNGSMCGVDTSIFSADAEARKLIRTEYGIQDDDICILFVGRLTIEKGVCDLVKAFGRLSQRHKNIHLLLVGPDEAALGQRWKEFSRVYQVGFTQTVNQYMAAGDVLCLPSYREGFGSVLIEAGAVGLPVLASRIYGITDAVVENESGLLHRPHDIDDLTNKLEKLILSADLRLQLGRSARARALQLFDQNVVTAEFAAFFERLVKTNSSVR